MDWDCYVCVCAVLRFQYLPKDFDCPAPLTVTTSVSRVTFKIINVNIVIAT